MCYSGAAHGWEQTCQHCAASNTQDTQDAPSGAGAGIAAGPVGGEATGPEAAPAADSTEVPATDPTAVHAKNPTGHLATDSIGNIVKTQNQTSTTDSTRDLTTNSTVSVNENHENGPALGAATSHTSYPESNITTDTTADQEDSLVEDIELNLPAEIATDSTVDYDQSSRVPENQ